MKKPQAGFTIVELLIFIVAMAILATILVVAYRGVLNQANDTAIRSDSRQFANQIELFYA